MREPHRQRYALSALFTPVKQKSRVKVHPQVLIEGGQSLRCIGADATDKHPKWLCPTGRPDGAQTNIVWNLLWTARAYGAQCARMLASNLSILRGCLPPRRGGSIHSQPPPKKTFQAPSGASRAIVCFPTNQGARRHPETREICSPDRPPRWGSNKYRLEFSMDSSRLRRSMCLDARKLSLYSQRQASAAP